MQSAKKSKVFVFGYSHFAFFRTVVSLVLGALLLITGCSKLSQESSSAPKSSAAGQSSADGTPAVAGSLAADEAAKRAAVEWALKEDEIKNDPNGQWAIQATASSSYNDAQGQADWSANQVAGPPNVDRYADDGKAWAPKTLDGGIEWLDLKYVKPVHASEVRVRESFGSGALIKVELFDEQGGTHVVWTGSDPTKGLSYLVLKFPKTGYKSARVKLTLATNLVPGWNEIDAVQLVGADQ